MTQQVATIVSVKAKDGKRDEVLELFKRHLAPRASENPDQKMVVWVADAGDPNAFHIFELYSSKEAMEKNARADWFWEYMSQAGPLLDGQPELKLGEPRWTKA